MIGLKNAVLRSRQLRSGDQQMLGVNVEGRSQHLSLALFAQAVVSALLDYSEKGDHPALKPLVGDALAALKGIESGDLQHVTQRKALNNHQQVLTLQQVWSRQDRTEAIRLMGNLLEDVGALRKDADIDRLVELFLKLQMQALWNFEQPRTSSSRLIRELCQTR